VRDLNRIKCQLLQSVVGFSVWFQTWAQHRDCFGHSYRGFKVGEAWGKGHGTCSPRLVQIFDLNVLIMGCLFISSTHGMTFIRQLWAWFHRFFRIVLWSLRLMVGNLRRLICRLKFHRVVSQLRCFFLFTFYERS
jgi:hypothetical protein